METTEYQQLALLNASSDSLQVKRVYIDMAGDLAAGVLLSGIVKLSRRDNDGNLLTPGVEKDGEQWIAKENYEWWDDLRVSAKEAARCLKVLADKGLVITERSLSPTRPIPIVRINWPVFLAAFNATIDVKADDIQKEGLL